MNAVKGSYFFIAKRTGKEANCLVNAEVAGREYTARPSRAFIYAPLRAFPLWLSDFWTRSMQLKLYF